MKNKTLKLSSMIAMAFVLCSCYNFQNKDINEMNLIELNHYREYLNNQNTYLKEQNNILSEKSDGKTYQEIIDMMNYVNDEIVKANVMITNESRSFFQASTTSSGSGTIIREDNRYYYALTNNHVIYSLGNRVSYYVYDYLNNEYTNAQVMFSDPNYDMAIVRFAKGKTTLKVINLASEDVEMKENIIVVGQPQGQRNTITFGEVLSYGVVNCSDCDKNISNIKYECVYYDAITNNGNSGGMILNYNYELVGVVTFGMNASNGEYLYGAGSPVSKVKEFFSVNDFEVGDSHE